MLWASCPCPGIWCWGWCVLAALKLCKVVGGTAAMPTLMCTYVTYSIFNKLGRAITVIMSVQKIKWAWVCALTFCSRGLVQLIHMLLKPKAGHTHPYWLLGTVPGPCFLPVWASLAGTLSWPFSKPCQGVSDNATAMVVKGWHLRPRPTSVY